MNWDHVEGKWNQLRRSAKQQWGKLTDDDLQQIAGTRDQLVGKLQERYGIALEEARKRADDWVKAQKDGESQVGRRPSQNAEPETHHAAKKQTSA